MTRTRTNANLGKKVQAVGRNQAVIIHTAIGQHLDELRALFADVVSSAKTG
jgi:hypothetical protein